MKTLRDTWGRKPRKLGSLQVLSSRPSIQGIWSPFTQYR